MGVPAPSIDWYIHVQLYEEDSDGEDSDREDSDGEDSDKEGSNGEHNNGSEGRRNAENDDSFVLIETSTRVTIVEEPVPRRDNLEQTQSVLTISSLIRSSDMGQYKCSGRNQVRNLIDTITTSYTFLTVYGKTQHIVALSTL